MANNPGPPEDEEEKRQLKNLFNKLDKNKDGHIDFKELNEYYTSINSKNSKNFEDSAEARKLFERISSPNGNKAGVINFDFNDFMEYVSQKDQKIRLFFNQLDKDKNGIIDRDEIKKGFEELGIILTTVIKV